MDRIRDIERISFEQIEVALFRNLQQAFCRELQQIIREIDVRLLLTRDRGRYQVKDVRSRKVETLLGEVEIRRRYYWDNEKREHVALLDRALKIEKRERISGGLAVMGSLLAVMGPSYRGATEALSGMFGYKPLSHEGLRQLMIRLGEVAEQEQEDRLSRCDGRKRVPLLVIEADGYWVPIQRNNRRRRETRLMLAHEGWKPRSPGSSEYELVKRTHHFDLSKTDFWYEASLHLHSKYDIDENTMVVINGDRASWIRKGVDYFPKAIYQVDRFHVKRDIMRLLKATREQQKAALKAFDESNPEKLLTTMLEAVDKHPDAKKRAKIMDLCKEVARIPESFKDYRVRLREMGYETEGLRGLGAIESNVDKFSNRTKKRGRSWRPTGLRAILHGLVKHFEGSLAHLASRASRLKETPYGERMKRRIEQARNKTISDVFGNARPVMPLTTVGTTRSGGLSRLFRNLNDTTPAMT